LRTQADHELHEEYEAYKASLRQQLDADLLAFKHQLRIEVQDTKEATRLAAIQALPPPPRSAAKSARKARRLDPLSRPPSRAQSQHSSPNRTPVASPICPLEDPPTLLLSGSGIPPAPTLPVPPAPSLPPAPPVALTTLSSLNVPALLAQVSALTAKVDNLDMRVVSLEGYPDFGLDFKMDYGEPPSTAMLDRPQPTGWDGPSPPPVARIDDPITLPPLTVTPIPHHYFRECG
jgi:hypothetical protein